MEFEVLVVDDHALVREGLRTLLDAQDDLRVVGEAKTANEALALTRKLQPDVVVLDVRLPDRDGIEICGEIRELSPQTRILMCSGLADGSALIEAARAGADGFVSKEAANAEIVDAFAGWPVAGTNLQVWLPCEDEIPSGVEHEDEGGLADVLTLQGRIA